MFGISPGSRQRRGRGLLTPADYGRVLYAGSASGITYDPGVSPVAADSCLITVPPRSFDLVYLCFGSITWLTASHGVGTAVFSDGNRISNDLDWINTGDGHNGCFFGPVPVTIPGDGKSHTIGLYVNDSLATGNVTFGERWITAHPVMP